MSANETQTGGADATPGVPSGINPEVYGKHFEEFTFLWEQRLAALRSPSCDLRDVKLLEQRIKLHVDALLLPGLAAVPIFEKYLAGDNPLAVFAASYVMLRMKSEAAAQKVIDAFLTAVPENVDGFRMALCQGPVEFVEKSLRDAATSAEATVAAVATEALLFHHRPGPLADRLDEFLKHALPLVRRTAWRIVALRE